ncbi:hypothetical protein [Actinomadura viridis]|uniref:Uncharacterized protein n=1 Tax=Actinomadura viridis TaxID=58110 RepID=A0A931DJX3_9ACTN|nr:hypothetical protein [Actinomadura viridis]MBG6090787.1 hypothetical protein [Actinomadura viridis]
MRTVLAVFVIGTLGLASHAYAEVPVTPPCGPRLASLELPGEPVHSGGKADGSVTLNCARPQATTVTLASAEPAWASVPESVTVPAGATEAVFPIQTHQPDYIYGEYGVAITASLPGETLTRALKLKPGLKFFAADSSVISGDDVVFQIGLNGPAPEGGLTIPLESDNDALRMPASVTIPQGALGVAGFRGKTTRIPQDAQVTVTAKLPGQTRTALVALRAWTYDPGDWSLTGPARLRGGGFYTIMSLNLPNPVPHGGIHVTFTSDEPRMNLPSAMDLPEGTSGARTVQVSAPYDLDRDVTITATIEGVGARSHTLHVGPGLKQITFTDWPLYGGRTYEGTVELGTATSEQVTITLTSDNPAMQVPAQVVIPAGRSSGTFTATTSTVEYFQYATVTARLDNTFLEESFFVEPASG